MRIPYKEIPYRNVHAAFPRDKTEFRPILNVRLNNTAHGPKTTPFEAVVDSGAPYCYFHGDIGRVIGLTIESGIKDTLGGIISTREVADTFFHDVWLWVGLERVPLRAGFCNTLAVAAVLGRNGFFDNFKVTFDHSTVPPCFDVDRILRS